MISLKDSIEIRSTPGQIFAWLRHMPQEYQAWHPDHVACRVLHGSIMEVGSEFECEEFLHGKLHTMRFRVTKVLPDKRIEFEVLGMGRGAFEAQVSGESVWFVAELDIGTDAPLIGHLFDFILSRFFNQRIESMRQHMAEEGRNLKAFLESSQQLSLGQEAA